MQGQTLDSFASDLCVTVDDVINDNIDMSQATAAGLFDINNGDRVITIYEVRRKIKAENFEASYNPNYKFEHNYAKHQQKLAKRYAGRNRW